MLQRSVVEKLAGLHQSVAGNLVLVQLHSLDVRGCGCASLKLS